MSFEEKLEEAKKILEELAKPDLALDNATKLYKNGIKVLEEATKMLESAKLEYEAHEAKES